MLVLGEMIVNHINIFLYSSNSNPSSYKGPGYLKAVQVAVADHPHCDTQKRHTNDPPAGSPTETLLRLLLPLSDQVRFTST